MQPTCPYIHKHIHRKIRKHMEKLKEPGIQDWLRYVDDIFETIINKDIPKSSFSSRITITNVSNSSQQLNLRITTKSHS